MPTNVNDLIAYIQQHIYANGHGAITGTVLATVLITIVGFFATYYQKNVSGLLGWVSLADYATAGSADQTMQIAAAAAAWNAATTTSFGASYPAATAKPLKVPAGQWTSTSGLVITSSGTGASVIGDGEISQLYGVGLSMQSGKSYVHGLNLNGASPFGLQFTQNGRRESITSDIYIRDKTTVGLSYVNSGAFDNLTNCLIENCYDGLHAYGTLGSQFVNIDQVNNTNVSFDLFGPGEVKLDNCRALGGFRPMWIRGSGLVTTVENYIRGITLTAANNRNIGVLGVTDTNGDGTGYVKLQLAAKIACTVQNAGSIFVGGAAGVAATARFGISTNNAVPTLTSGTISSVIANGTQLLSAPVSYTSGNNFSTATAVAAAINANTGATGYSAVAGASFVYIQAPVSQGAAANGLTFTAAATGDVTVSLATYVSLNYATPHGLNVGDDAWFDGSPTYAQDAVHYYGQHAVAWVKSSTVVVSECPYGGTDIAGNAWVIPRLRAGETGASVSYLSGGTATLLPITITAADDTTITLNWLTSQFPSLTLPGPSVTLQGWDLVIECLDVNNLRVNDVFFIGGNINRTLIKSAYHVEFWGTRLKQAIWIDTRANAAMQANQIHFRRPGRGRDSETTVSIPICGSVTGWTDISGQDDSGSTTAGAGYIRVAAPNKNLPMIGWIAQINEDRVYEDHIERHIGPLVESFTTAGLSNPVGINSGQNPTAVADQTAIIIVPPLASGVIAVGNGAGQAARMAMFAYYAKTNPVCQFAIATPSGTVMTATTGILTGTTGTAGKINVSAASNGLLYVENRTGVATNIKWLFLNV